MKQISEEAFMVKETVFNDSMPKIKVNTWIITGVPK